MSSTHDELKAAFLRLQRLAPTDRDPWLSALRDGDPSLHRALSSFLAFQVDALVLEAVEEEEDGPGVLAGTRYQDRGLLGIGGMGEVRRVHDPSLQRAVALKFLRSRHLHDPDPDRRAAAILRFVTEARIQASLVHPNIPPVHERGELPDGRPYLTMAIVEGRTLRAWMGEWDRKRLLQAFEQACRAVAHAHEAGVLHRDLKPSNIMVDPSGDVRVVDWGLAIPSEARGGTSTAGTPAYMAPEQLDPSAPLDETTDVYALGGILYALLAGRDPAPGTSTPVPGAPAALNQLVCAARQVDPKARPPSADVLAEGVAAWLDRGPARTGWPLAAAGLATLAVGLGVVGWLALSPTEDPRERIATERLAALESTLDHPARTPAEIDEAFDVFFSLEENIGTRAIADAWLARAEILTRRDEAEAAERALARAFAAARTPDQRSDALVQLASAQAERGRWGALAATLELLGPSRDPRARQAAWRLALATRSDPPPDGTPAGLKPLAERLRAAMPLPTDLDADTPIQSWDSDGDGRPEVWVLETDGLIALGWPDSRPARDTRLGWPIAVVGRRATTLAIDGRPHLLAPGPDRLHLVEATGEPLLRPRASWAVPDAAGRPFFPSVMDLDGDGSDELLISHWVERRVDVLRRTPADGSWTISTPDGSINHVNSEVRGLTPAGVDRAGRPLLAAALGAWGGYDVRLVREDEAGALSLVERRRVGAVHSMVAVRGRSGPRLVALAEPGPPRPRLGVSDPGPRSPASLVDFALDGERLADRQVRDLKLGRPRRLIAADLDGDDIDELAMQLGDHLYIARASQGTWAGFALAEVEVLLALDGDDDGTDELVVRDTRTDSLWVLGAGSGRLSTLSPPSPPRLELPADGWLAERASQTDQLVALGFAKEAAETLTDLARLTSEPSDQAEALVRAGSYLELDADWVGARGLYEDALARDADSDAARRGAARVAEAAHDFLGARRHLEGLDPEAASALDPLAKAPTWTLSADAPLDRVATEMDPFGLRVSSGEGLELEATDDQVLLRIPLRRRSDRVGLELKAELERLSWSGGLDVALLPDDGGPGVELWIHGSGGGGHTESTLGAHCGAPQGVAPLRMSTAHRPVLGPISVRVDCIPGEGRGFVALAGPDQGTHGPTSTPPPTPIEGAWTLTLRGRATAGGLPLRTRLLLKSLVITGFEATSSEGPGRLAATAAVIAGRPERAVPGPPSDATTAAAMLDLGQADALVADLPARLETVPWLGRALRLRPELGRTLARERPTQAVGPLWRNWGRAVEIEPDAPDLLDLFSTGPLGSLPLDSLDAASRARIQLARAHAWRRDGALARSRTALERATISAASLEDPSMGVEIHLERARLELEAGEPDLAIQEITRALQRSRGPEILGDRLHADPELARARVHPDWPGLIDRARSPGRDPGPR